MASGSIHTVSFALVVLSIAMTSCGSAQAQQTTRKRVIAGQTIGLHGWTNSRPDAGCTSIPANIAVVSPPRGGTTSQRVGHSNRAGKNALGGLSPCAGMKVNSRDIYYTARPDFSGEDRFTVRVFAESGTFDHLFILQVAPSKQTATTASAKPQQNNVGTTTQSPANPEVPTPPPPPANNTPNNGEVARAPVVELDFHGICQNLVIDGEDRTVRCLPMLVNYSIAGTPGIAVGFASGEGGKVDTAIYFKSNEQGQIENGALRQPINQMVLIVNGAKQNIDAKGSCLFPDPKVPVVVECEARTANSTYAARFLTDGAKPTATNTSPQGLGQ